MSATEVAISAVQCWTSIEENLGVVPCTVMSMMSRRLLSSACEVDICGVLGMHALRLASETPSALLDWNNNYGTDPRQGVCFHCSNLPKHFFRSVKMGFPGNHRRHRGQGKHLRHLRGHYKPEKMSFARFSTDDTAGKMRGYVGEGRFTDDALNTFGGPVFVEIPNLQKLLHFICEKGSNIMSPLTSRRCGVCSRSFHALFGLGYVLARCLARASLVRRCESVNGEYRQTLSGCLAFAPKKGYVRGCFSESFLSEFRVVIGTCTFERHRAGASQCALSRRSSH